MSAKRVGDETSVFTFGNLACEGVSIPRADVYAAPPRPVYRIPAERTQERTFPVYLMLTLGALCAAALLVLTLLGQIRLTKLNDRAVEAETVLTQMQESNRMLQIRAEEYSGFELSAIHHASDAPTDTATVLHVRRGSRIDEGWKLVVDTVTECFR